MLDLRINTGEIELQVREYACDGETIIFLHFGGGNLMMWHDVVPYFDDRYRLVLVDLRGHGRSDSPATGYHIDTMASDVVLIMASLGIERAHVVGSSLGAEVALAMAANHPEKVLSISCDGASSSEYGPYGLWEGSETAFQEHVSRITAKLGARKRPVFPSIEASVAFERQKYEKDALWNPVVEGLVRYGILETEAGRFAFGWPDWLVEYIPRYFNYRLEEYYQRVECPVLFLLGAEEMRNQRVKTALLGLADLVDQARIVEIPGWIHPYGWMLDPEGASQAVLAFLSSLQEQVGKPSG